MTLAFTEKFTENSRNLLRLSGYFEIYDHHTRKTSYIRKLRGDPYPRFHVYVNEETPGRLQLNLHLDMKKPSYEGSSAHSGEYGGEVVEQEADRIRGMFKSRVATDQSAKPSKPKSFWQKLFGFGSDE